MSENPLCNTFFTEKSLVDHQTHILYLSLLGLVCKKKNNGIKPIDASFYSDFSI